MAGNGWQGWRAGDWLSPDARAFVIALIVLCMSFYGMLWTPLGESARGMLATFITIVAQHYFYRAAIKQKDK